MEEDLEAILERPVIDIRITREGRNGRVHTDIYLERETHKHRISVNSIVLEYDPQKLEEDLEGYVGQQLDAHRKYKELAETELQQSNDDTNQARKQLRSLDELPEFVPDNLKRYGAMLARIIIPLSYWIRGMGVRNHFRELVHNANLERISYIILKEIVDYGNGMWQEALTNKKTPEEMRPKLDELVKITKDLSSIYHELIQTKERYAQAATGCFNRLYPDKPLE